jgi:hypothetical protein
VHAVVGGFTPGNTSFLVMNPDFHFVLAMDVIVCTAGVWEPFMDQCVYESDRFGGGSVMVLDGICHDGCNQFKIVQGTLNAVK